MCCSRFKIPSLPLFISKRFISSSDVSTALRPFYFAVHPDFFCNYPKEKEVNENSLKQLNGLIDGLVTRGRVPSVVSLKFFMRKKELQNVFQPVTVKVQSNCIKATVESILEACDLPLDGAKNLVSKSPPQKSSPLSSFMNRNYTEEFTAESWDEVEFVAKKREDGLMTLVRWLEKNAEKAKESFKAGEAVRGEIKQLSNYLVAQLGLRELRWACGWNTEHFKGCLQSLKNLAEHHPTTMLSLKGKTLVFGNETGVNLNGHVSLNSGEVRHNWLDLIQRVESYDAVLNKIPSYEKALSRAMREIRVTRRRFGPPLLAEDYELQLRRLITGIGDYKCRRSFPLSCPEDLSHLQLVVETAAGPLMLTPTGQIVTPSSCPVFLLLNFIGENHLRAKELLDVYEVERLKEEELRKRCIEEFELCSLVKDDNITPSRMIEFLENLLENSEKLVKIRGAKVCVTHYFSVLADGELCIPWNFR